MVEKLMCYVLLLHNGLIAFDKYDAYLNMVFLKDPDNAFLLDLHDKDVFGKLLLKELKDIYYQKSLSIDEFGKRTYLLWKEIPCCIGKDEPFHTLSFADDPLSWGDVEQSCKIYEDLFAYYIDKH